MSRDLKAPLVPGLPQEDQSLQLRGRDQAQPCGNVGRVASECRSGPCVEDGQPYLRGSVALVVEAHTTMRQVTSALLRQFGCSRVLEAENTSEALRRLRQSKCDFVVCDSGISDKLGLDLLAKLRADVLLRELPFLLVVANASREDLLCALNGGADGILVKPFTASTFSSRLYQAMSKRHRPRR